MRYFINKIYVLYIYSKCYQISLLNNLIIEKNVSDISVLLILSSVLIFFFGILADQISLLRKSNKYNWSTGRGERCWVHVFCLWHCTPKNYVRRRAQKSGRAFHFSHASALAALKRCHLGQRFKR